MMFPGLIIRSSSIHAAGCYTTRAIKKGVRLCEYDGPRMTKAVADARYEGRHVTYLFSCGGDEVIDGFGTSMFINHSCDPNCETHEEKGRVWVKAIRKIEAGEEITYDYCLYDGDEGEAVCNCGAKKCRGTMYSREEIRRRKRSMKKTALRKTKSSRTTRKKSKSK